MQSPAKMSDAVLVAAGYGRPFQDRAGLSGWVEVDLYDEHGKLKLHQVAPNLITEVGDQYYGDRASNIVSATRTPTVIATGVNAVVTTSAAHGFGVGDVVTLAGNTPTGYNGDWAINAVTATTFTIYVGTALGAGTAFGTAISKHSLPRYSGMRYGTGVTAVAKTGAGAAIVTYVATSSLAMDSGFPTSALSGASRRIQYKTTWAAGIATANGISEVVLTFEQPLTDVAGTAANTISRALLSPVVNKAAGDSLAVTWNQDLLGA